MRIYPNSFCQLGYFGNFIQDLSARTLMRCVIASQNNDQCRIANYNSQTRICSLINENSFIGQIISLSTDNSIIFLQLCIDLTQQEPEYLYFGTYQPAVTLQHTINNSQQAAMIHLPVYIARYIHRLVSCICKNIMLIHQMKRNFDADFAWNYFVSTGYNFEARKLYTISSSSNTTISVTNDYIGICLSNRYITVTRKMSHTFQIRTTMARNGNTVIRDHLFILTDDVGMKSTNLLNRTEATFIYWPIRLNRQGFTNIVGDSSDRTYTACSSCLDSYPCIGRSVYSFISYGLNNTQLETLDSYWYTVGQANIIKYRSFRY
ncbi:hypothetical protein I4U23_030008 [Adineta vaga]|nr:hypothetical protein I4U23_030008 [Adineta vaga]